MATGSAGRLQPAPAGQGAGDCSNTDQSQEVPVGKASFPAGHICFITRTSKLASLNTFEPSLCNPCQLLAESHGKGEMYSKEEGNTLMVAELSRLSWFLSRLFDLSHEFSLCVCLYAGFITR